ncbi:hypothetical protein C8R42DRAFT_716555 [Lentinula raphanica]|nr:hypothetical protein C8R42DRAFT_716555 [Lentinula raphanica]
MSPFIQQPHSLERSAACIPTFDHGLHQFVYVDPKEVYIGSITVLALLLKTDLVSQPVPGRLRRSPLDTLATYILAVVGLINAVTGKAPGMQVMRQDADLQSQQSSSSQGSSVPSDATDHDFENEKFDEAFVQLMQELQVTQVPFPQLSEEELAQWFRQLKLSEHSATAPNPDARGDEMVWNDVARFFRAGVQ